MVLDDGTIDLGSPYGSVHVAGMTIEQVTQAIDKQLQKSISKPDGSVELVRAYSAQPITGQYLVGPDGTINLREYGVVHVAGNTMSEAKTVIQNNLRQFLDSPELAVDVAAYNSKVYYVIIQVAGRDDSVRRCRSPATRPCWTPSPRPTGRCSPRRSGLPGRLRTISAGSRYCPSIGAPSPKGPRRRLTTGFCPATGCT